MLVSTSPTSRSGCRSAKPSAMGPPQSCATTTSGPVISSAAASPSRSSTRSARVRGCSSSFGEPHPEVVDRDHPPARRRGGDEPAPQVGPGGVAVDAEHGAALGLDLVVQQVPATRGSRRIGDRDEPRPAGVEAGHRGAERAGRRRIGDRAVGPDGVGREGSAGGVGPEAVGPAEVRSGAVTR